MGTGIPKYQAVAAARIPTTGAAATIPPYLDNPPHLNIRFCYMKQRFFYQYPVAVAAVASGAAMVAATYWINFVLFIC